MDKRIEIQSKDKGTLIRVKAFIDQAKQRQLGIWLAAWTFCGLAVIAHLLFREVERDVFRFALIFLAFWLYFEWKIVKIFRWRKSGEEQFWITEDQMQYGRTYNNRGILRPYSINQINAVRPIEAEKNNFVKTFFDSYWVMGDEQLAFTVSGKVIPFGLRLSKKEAQKLAGIINKELDKASD